MRRRTGGRTTDPGTALGSRTRRYCVGPANRRAFKTSGRFGSASAQIARNWCASGQPRQASSSGTGFRRATAARECDRVRGRAWPLDRIERGSRLPGSGEGRRPIAALQVRPALYETINCVVVAGQGHRRRERRDRFGRSVLAEENKPSQVGGRLLLGPIRIRYLFLLQAQNRLREALLELGSGD
jgi:hypothetical protein